MSQHVQSKISHVATKSRGSKRHDQVCRNIKVVINKDEVRGILTDSGCWNSVILCSAHHSDSTERNALLWMRWKGDVRNLGLSRRNQRSPPPPPPKSDGNLEGPWINGMMENIKKWLYRDYIYYIDHLALSSARNVSMYYNEFFKCRRP